MTILKVTFEGPTASGKSTFARALVELAVARDYLVILEDGGNTHFIGNQDPAKKMEIVCKTTPE